LFILDSRLRRLAMNNAAARLMLCGVVLLAVTGTVGVGAALALAAKPQGQVLEVAVKSGRLSVRAHEAPLAGVLEAISRKAGVKILLHGDLDAPITDTFADLPLDEGLRRLSRWHSVVLIYGPLPGGSTGPVLTEMWVMGSPQAQGPAEKAARDTPRIDARADARPPEDQRGWTSDLATALKYGKSTNLGQTVETLVREQGAYAIVAALREKATRDPAPATRRAAIKLLASMTSLDAADAVQTALGDPNPGVRFEAQKALAQQRRARAREDSSSNPSLK
jgi:HEAT repeats